MSALRANDLLLGNTHVFASLHPRTKLRPVNIRRKRNRKHDLAKVKRVMETAAAGNVTPPPSLASLSRQTKVHVSFLSRKFPDLAKQINAKYEEYQIAMGEARRALIDATVRATVTTIVERGQYPGRARMKKALPSSISLFDRVAHAAWRDEIKERNLTIPSKPTDKA
jgi:hypothetical protein